MTQKLLLISERKEDEAFAAEVAIVAGLSLQVAPNADEGVRRIVDDNPKVVFVDTSSRVQYEEFERAVQDTVGLFSDQVNANFLHFLSSEDIHQVSYLIKSPIFGHYVMRNGSDPAGEGKHYGRLVKATLNDRAFNLANTFPNVKIQTVQFKNTNQKQEAVEAIKNYLIAAKFKSRMAVVVANAVDELLMNAMFDAPVDEMGRQVYASTSRATHIELREKSAVEMQVAFDGKYAAVTAIDQFGSLDKAKLMAHISKRYTEEEYKVKTTTAGAGIGLATVFRSGGSFFFVSEQGVRTEVTVFFKRTDNFREFRDQFRFISTQFYF